MPIDVQCVFVAGKAGEDELQIALCFVLMVCHTERCRRDGSSRSGVVYSKFVRRKVRYKTDRKCATIENIGQKVFHSRLISSGEAKQHICFLPVRLEVIRTGNDGHQEVEVRIWICGGRHVWVVEARCESGSAVDLDT